MTLLSSLQGSTREGFVSKTFQIFGKIHFLVVVRPMAACFFKGIKGHGVSRDGLLARKSHVT